MKHLVNYMKLVKNMKLEINQVQSIYILKLQYE